MAITITQRVVLLFAARSLPALHSHLHLRACGAHLVAVREEEGDCVAALGVALLRARERTGEGGSSTILAQPYRGSTNILRVS